MKKFLAVILSLSITLSSAVYCFSNVNNSEDKDRYQKMDYLIEEMMKETDPTDGSIWNMENTSAFKWSYINGCMASAMLQLHSATNDNAYKDFADTYMSPFITEDGYIAASNFKASNYTLDDLNSGKALVQLIALDSPNSEKYRKAVSDTLYTDLLQYMLKNKITAEGNLWHKNSYPYQVWLDGIYMETPFWLEYELVVADDSTAFTTAAENVTKQIENVRLKQCDSVTGLYYHGYDARADKTSGSYNPSKAMSWAKKDVGVSANYWLRGTGWFAMALVDNIELMQSTEKRYDIDLSKQKDSLTSIYTDLMNSLLKYQDNATGMWYQVINMPNEKYNYLETSGSAAVSYSLMKGYNIGIADIAFYKSGLKAFRGICDEKLSYDNKKGQTQLNDICITAGLGGSSSSATIGPKHKSRDGSYDYYVSEKTVANDAKGVAPLLFAYSQVIKFNGSSEDTTENTTVTTTETTTESTTITTTESTIVTTTETTTESTTVTTTETTTESTTITTIETSTETTTITAVDDSETTTENFLFGDADGDGKLTTSDSAQLVQMVLNSSFEVSLQRKTSNWFFYLDVDRNNKITSADAAMVLQKVLNSGFKMKCED